MHTLKCTTQRYLGILPISAPLEHTIFLKGALAAIEANFCFDCPLLGGRASTIHFCHERCKRSSLFKFTHFSISVHHLGNNSNRHLNLHLEHSYIRQHMHTQQ